MIADFKAGGTSYKDVHALRKSDAHARLRKKARRLAPPRWKQRAARMKNA